MYHHSSSRPPPYSQPRYSSSSEYTVPSRSSSQWPYTVHREEAAVKTNGQHPSFPQTHDAGSADNSFRRTLLEIEDTYYRTFPEAAQADGYQPRWSMSSTHVERNDQSSVSFFSQTSGTRVGVMPQSYASSYPGYSSQSASYDEGSLARGLGVGDVQTGSSSQMYTSSEGYHRSHPLSAPPVMPSVDIAHEAYHLLKIPQAEPSIAKALCSTDPAPSSLPPSYGSNAYNGPLSEPSRGQGSWRAVQDNYSTTYVNSNASSIADARVPPMGSLGYPEATLATVPSAPPPSVAPLASQYAPGSLPSAMTIPPSPHHLTPTSYYLGVSTGESNPTNHADEAYHSPDPGSPSSITLYPVPQAPLNHHTIPSWSPHQISPEPLPAPPEASVGRSTKRKRGKDSDKKPPLACLFCRGRKIACGPPPPDGDGKTCNQCHRRSLKCDYPAESRRGMRKEKSIPNLNTGGAKVVVKTKKRR